MPFIIRRGSWFLFRVSFYHEKALSLNSATLKERLSFTLVPMGIAIFNALRGGCKCEASAGGAGGAVQEERVLEQRGGHPVMEAPQAVHLLVNRNLGIVRIAARWWLCIYVGNL